MILVVDDDNDVRAMIKRALTELGYPVVEASNGEDALAHVSRIRGPISSSSII